MTIPGRRTAQEQLEKLSPKEVDPILEKHVVDDSLAVLEGRKSHDGEFTDIIDELHNSESLAKTATEEIDRELEEKEIHSFCRALRRKLIDDLVLSHRIRVDEVEAAEQIADDGEREAVLKISAHDRHGRRYSAAIPIVNLLKYEQSFQGDAKKIFDAVASDCADVLIETRERYFKRMERPVEL